MSKQDKVCKQGSIVISRELIVGAVGAGDVFAVGVLAGVYNHMPM